MESNRKYWITNSAGGYREFASGFSEEARRLDENFGPEFACVSPALAEDLVSGRWGRALQRRETSRSEGAMDSRCGTSGFGRSRGSRLLRASTGGGKPLPYGTRSRTKD